MALQLSLIVGEDSCPLLTTVLKTVESKIGQLSSIWMSPNTENTTFFIKRFYFVCHFLYLIFICNHQELDLHDFYITDTIY
ncbi:Uncharacterised protein [Mycobacterium tuberculosis]|nr:Uncharacterised protein [Mycobacterium tuberculosis]